MSDSVAESAAPHDAVTEPIPEFAVIDGEGKWVGLLTFRSRSEAEEYLAWLVGPRREEMKALAEQEDPAMTNFAAMAWRAEEKRSYRVAERTISPWRFLPSSDGV